MRFHNRQNTAIMSLNLNINNGAINRVDNTKFLGIHLEENLNWDKHANHLI